MEQFKNMSGYEVTKKYWNLLKNGKITYSAYNKILDYWRKEKEKAVEYDKQKIPQIILGKDEVDPIAEWEKLEQETHQKKITSYDKLKMLLRDNQWHKISEWDSGGKDKPWFIGYKAPSRISELMRDEPNLIITKEIGKFTYYKINE